MLKILNALNFIVSVYMMIIFFRIILTWFTGIGTSSIQDFLNRITDPYLNWFRRFTFLRIGFLDLSPLAAVGVLSLVSRILGMLVRYGRITIGIILVLLVQAVWGAISFILIFLIAVLALRLIAYLLRQNVNSQFWRVIDIISQPVIYKINRFLYKDRIINYIPSLLITLAGLGLLYFGLKNLVAFASLMLARLPF